MAVKGITKENISLFFNLFSLIAVIFVKTKKLTQLNIMNKILLQNECDVL